MTNPEFSNKFTVLLDSYGADSQFGKSGTSGRIVLNEYEKSVFLTEAQKELVIALYNGKGFLLESFESSEEIRRYLSALVDTKDCAPVVEGSSDTDLPTISDKSVLYALPADVAYIVYEQARISKVCGGHENEYVVNVVPVTHDEYERLSKNPFRRQNSHRVLRIDSGDGIVELISDYEILEYKVRYIKHPSPIVLEDFSGTGVSVDGCATEQECSLDPMLHDSILRRAVQLAVAAKAKN